MHGISIIIPVLCPALKNSYNINLRYPLHTILQILHHRYGGVIIPNFRPHDRHPLKYRSRFERRQPIIISDHLQLDAPVFVCHHMDRVSSWRPAGVDYSGSGEEGVD